MQASKFAVYAAVVGACAVMSQAATIPLAWTVKTYAPQTATVGDTVAFTWAGNHDLALFTGDVPCAEKNSNAGTVLSPVSSPGSGSFTFKAPGTYTFLCRVGGHCNGGQRVVFTVAPAA